MKEQADERGVLVPESLLDWALAQLDLLGEWYGDDPDDEMLDNQEKHKALHDWLELQAPMCRDPGEVWELPVCERSLIRAAAEAGCGFFVSPTRGFVVAKIARGLGWCVRRAVRTGADLPDGSPAVAPGESLGRYSSVELALDAVAEMETGAR